MLGQPQSERFVHILALQARLACAVVVTFLAIAPAQARAQQPALVERVWYEDQTPRKIWMATDEIAIVFDARGRNPQEAQTRFEQSTPEATLIKQDGPVAYYKLPPQQTPGQTVVAARRETGVRHAGPVFYQHPGNPHTAMALSGDIIVRFHAEPTPQALDQFAKRFGVTLSQTLSFAPHTFVFDARSASDSLDLANRIRTSEGVAAAYPNWIRSLGRR